MTLYLRHKFLLGFGGLLAVIILVTTVGSGVIDAYSNALERILRENFDSVVYGEAMKGAVQSIEDGLQASIWNDAPGSADSVQQGILLFEENLRKEQGNLTLPDEPQAVAHLAGLWHQYLRVYTAVLDTQRSAHERHLVFTKTILPLGDQLQSAAQQICDMNMANMSAVDGRARGKADEAKWVISFLVFAGAALATALLFFIGRAILKPLVALKDSVRQIQKGNLNVALQTRSKDEVGELTEAFNDMAAQLREYRQGEKARLIRTEHSTQSVIDSLDDAVAILNVTGTVELSNKTARELFDMHPGVHIPSRRDDLLRESFFSTLMMDTRSEQLGLDHALQVFVGGDERFFLPHAVPIKGEVNNVIGVTLVLADVTRLRRITELEIEPIAVVSHELKTPLTSMRMAMHMLSDERIGPLNSRQAELLSGAREDSERLNRIIESLLDISRMEAGKSRLELVPCLPQQLISQAADAFSVSYRNAGVDLAVRIAEDMPRVLADPARVDHVLSNLLSNALKFSRSGDTVTLSAVVETGEAVFTVADQGPGIPPDQVPHVFERFFRGKGEQSNRGAGLGLAIAKEIVEAHGGRIGVVSTPGQGSLFSFTLRPAND